MDWGLIAVVAACDHKMPPMAQFQRSMPQIGHRCTLSVLYGIYLIKMSTGVMLIKRVGITLTGLGIS